MKPVARGSRSGIHGSRDRAIAWGTEYPSRRFAVNLRSVKIPSLALWLAALAFAKDASAATSSDVDLAWSAPATCPARAEMEERIARIVGASPDARAHEVMTASVVITSEGAGFRADVKVGAGASTRSVAGATCNEVADAVALIIALAIDPRSLDREAPTPASPVTTPKEVPAALVPRRRVVHAGAAAMIDAQTLPATTLGAEIFAGWSPPHLSLEANAAISASARGTIDAQPAKGADFTLVHAGVRACYAIFDARFDVGPCASGGVDWIIASGFGAQAPADGTGRVFVGGLGARVTFEATAWLSLRLVAEALAPSARPRFEIDNAGDVYRTSGSLFRASLGLALHF